MSILEITSKNFEEEVINSEKPILLDFWAEWCTPCKMLSPVIDEIAQETENVKFGKVNVDLEQGLAVKFGVRNIPTLILFKDGKAENVLVGVRPKEEILEMIK